MNQNTLASGLARGGYSSTVTDLIDLFKNYDLGVEQMPCPEILTMGYPRKPMTKDQCEGIKGFKEACADLAKWTGEYILKLRGMGFKTLGIVGIAGSPSCGIHQTTVDRDPDKGIRIDGSGIFIEELKEALEKEGQSMFWMDWDYRKKEDSLKKIDQKITDGLQIS